MVCAPAKSTSSQSPNTFPVASFQPPPLPQLRPARSPSIAALGGKLALKADEASAVPPLLAAATFVWVPVVNVHQLPLSASVTPPALRARTCQKNAVDDCPAATLRVVPVVPRQVPVHVASLVVS